MLPSSNLLLCNSNSFTCSIIALIKLIASVKRDAASVNRKKKAFGLPEEDTSMRSGCIPVSSVAAYWYAAGVDTGIHRGWILVSIGNGYWYAERLHTGMRREWILVHIVAGYWCPAGMDTGMRSGCIPVCGEAGYWCAGIGCPKYFNQVYAPAVDRPLNGIIRFRWGKGPQVQQQCAEAPHQFQPSVRQMCPRYRRTGN